MDFLGIALVAWVILIFGLVTKDMIEENTGRTLKNEEVKQEIKEHRKKEDIG